MNFTFSSRKAPRLTGREIALLALMSALMIGLKVVMAQLPNIEPVTLLIILSVLMFGAKTFYSVAVYILLEGIIYGFGIWWISYLYVWPILAAAALLVKRTGSYFMLTVLAASFGLAFGALCAIPYFITGGWAAGFSYWVSGIPFDLLHCAGNAAFAALLLKPLHKILCSVTRNGQPFCEKSE